MRQGGRTQAMIELIKRQRGFIIIPCYSDAHANGLLVRLEENGLRAHITKKINKSIIKSPYKTRFSIQIEVFN